MINEPKDETQGRITVHSTEEHQSYWQQMSDAEKQEFLRESYKHRNARDKYATSRDFHARELEIQAILKSLGEKESILDLACGNGYTLLSLAKQLDNWNMRGVDFSDNLIEGANYLREEGGGGLKSQPEFICNDAVKYLNNLEDESVGYVITQRFIQNLPSDKWQKKVVKDIYRVLKKGGRYLMCEGSLEGFNHLNEIRERVGLSIIPATTIDNIASIRIVDSKFENFAQSEVGFKLADKLGMSTYFIISRILHPLMVAPDRPHFDSKFNEYGRLIQENMDFAPGYGSNVLWVFEK